MKKIVNAVIRDPFTDKALRITDPDAQISDDAWAEAPTEPAAREVWVADWNRKHQIDLTTLLSIRLFVGNLRDLKAADGAKAFAILKALRRSKAKERGYGYIELEDDHYDWLLKTFEEKGSSLFPLGVTVATVLDSFRDLYTGDVPNGVPEGMVPEGAKTS